MKSENNKEPIRLLELEKEFAIWRVPISSLREQDKNARVMDNDKFDRLTNNIKNDGRLESLPLCFLSEYQSGVKYFYIISGHHRIRAAKKAGVLNIPCLVIEKELTRDEIISKQLSHNSLSGYDDINVLKDLYDEMEDIECKIASGLRPEDLKITDVNVAIDDVKVDLNFEIINILFLSHQVKKMDKIISYIDKDASVKIVDRKDFDKFADQARKIAKRENIVNMSAIFSKMLDYIEEVIKLKEDIDKAEKKKMKGNNYGKTNKKQSERKAKKT